MKTIAGLGTAGVFLLVARGWVSLALLLWLAARISHGLALAVFKEVLRAGWFDEAR